MPRAAGMGLAHVPQCQRLADVPLCLPQGLLNAHDRIAKETAQASGTEVTRPPPDAPTTTENMEAIRMVGLTKNPNEPLVSTGGHSTATGGGGGGGLG